MMSSVAPSQPVSSSLSGDDLSSGADQSQHEQQFAALLQNTPESGDAQSAASGSEMLSTLSTHLDTISRGIDADLLPNTQGVAPTPLAAGDPSSVSPPVDPVQSSGHVSPHSTLHEELSGLLDNYRRLVTFSISAQLTTTSSTTTTKTMNQIMKGS